MTPTGWATRLDPKIQVCCYEDNFPHHNELENWMVSTKWDAYRSVHKDQDRCKRKSEGPYNYRIVDHMNRFKTILIEQH